MQQREKRQFEICHMFVWLEVRGMYQSNRFTKYFNILWLKIPNFYTLFYYYLQSSWLPINDPPWYACRSTLNDASAVSNDLTNTPSVLSYPLCTVLFNLPIKVSYNNYDSIPILNIQYP